MPGSGGNVYMKRREFIAGLRATATWPLAAKAQFVGNRQLVSREAVAPNSPDTISLRIVVKKPQCGCLAE